MPSFDIARLGIRLKGPENQNIRFLIRRCQRSLVAIPGCGVPLLQCLLPLAARYRSCLDALLALATRLRASGLPLADVHAFTGQQLPGDSPTQNLMLSRYQDMVSVLRSSLTYLQPGDSHMEEAIAMSMILWIFGFPGHDIWSVHLNGLIALLELNRSHGLDASPLFFTASKVAAHADIKAFSLGRPQSSQKLWLRWDIFPVDQEIELARSKDIIPFTEFEISSGYPESLVTIIALLSAMIEDELAGVAPDTLCVQYLEVLTVRLRSQHPDALHCMGSAGHVDSPMGKRMEFVIRAWNPPQLPDMFSVDTRLALMTTWNIIRKAALIYLWRGGFERDVLVPLSSHLESLIERFVQEMCLGIDQVIQLAEKHHITVANALFWPLAIVANECSRYPHLQPRVLQCFQRMFVYFLIPHLQILEIMIQRLWERASQRENQGIVSLQLICLEYNSRLPLL